MSDKFDSGIIRVALLDYQDSRHHHYAPIFQENNFHVLRPEEIDFSNQTELSKQVDVAICSEEYNHCLSMQIHLLKQAGISTCMVMDGVLEWRNQWENPRSLSENNGPPLYEPALSTVVICMGNWQAELLRMLGCQGLCLPVGLPRFDPYSKYNNKANSQKNKPLNVLVSTANTLGFTDEQSVQMLDGLKAFKGKLESHFGNELITWRVSEKLANEILDNDSRRQSMDAPLIDVLEDFDILFSTPSSILLEGMLAKLRVCQLDFCQSPKMIHTIWNIDDKCSADYTFESIAHPTSKHLKFQEILLRHQVASPGESSKQLIQILTKLADKNYCPSDLLTTCELENLHALPAVEFDSQHVAQDEIKLLNIQYARAIQENKLLRHSNQILRKSFSSKVLYYLYHLFFNKSPND